MISFRYDAGRGLLPGPCKTRLLPAAAGPVIRRRHTRALQHLGRFLTEDDLDAEDGAVGVLLVLQAGELAPVLGRLRGPDGGTGGRAAGAASRVAEHVGDGHAGPGTAEDLHLVGVHATEAVSVGHDEPLLLVVRELDAVDADVLVVAADLACLGHAAVGGDLVGVEDRGGLGVGVGQQLAVTGQEGRVADRVVREVAQRDAEVHVRIHRQDQVAVVGLDEEQAEPVLVLQTRQGHEFGVGGADGLHELHRNPFTCNDVKVLRW